MMKKIFSMKYFAFMLGVMCMIPVMSACSDELYETVETKVNLIISADSFTFDAAGTKSFVIDVTSDPEPWSVALENGEDTWIDTQTEGNKVTVTVKANESTEPRTGILVFSNDVAAKAKAVVLQLGKDAPGFPRYRLIEDMTRLKMSPDGKYVAGVKIISSTDTEQIIQPILIVTDTDERILFDEMSVVPGDSYALEAVANNGTMILSNQSTDTCELIHIDGTTSQLQAPAGTYARGPMGVSISSDGSIVLGYMRQGLFHYPVKWTNLSPELLPVPEKNGWGDPVQQGAIPRGMSEDGSVIYGSVWDNQEAVIWKNGEVKYVAEDLQKIEYIEVKNMFGWTVQMEVLFTPQVLAHSYRLSPDGKHLSVTYQTATSVDYSAVYIMYSLYYNVETEEYEVLYDYESYTPWTTGNDGIVSLGTPDYGARYGYIYNINDKSMSTLSNWILSEYNIHMEHPNAILSYRTPDGQYMLGANAVDAGIALVYYNWYITPAQEN